MRWSGQGLHRGAGPGVSSARTRAEERRQRPFKWRRGEEGMKAVVREWGICVQGPWLMG